MSREFKRLKGLVRLPEFLNKNIRQDREGKARKDKTRQGNFFNSIDAEQTVRKKCTLRMHSITIYHLKDGAK